MTSHDGMPDRSIEGRLRARATLVPSPGHRSRVLAAVRGALEARPVAAAFQGHRLGGGGVLALAGMACAAAPALIGPWCIGMATIVGGGALSRPARPALVEQARMVGVELPPDALAAVGPAAGTGAVRRRADARAVDRPSNSPGRAAEPWLRIRDALVREL